MTRTMIALLALAAAPAVHAQGSDDPGYQMIDGIGACMLGGGAVEGTTAALDDLGWTHELDGETGLLGFRAGKGGQTFGFASSEGFCLVESTAIGTGDAETMFNLFLMGGNSGIEVTESGTNAEGCATHTLSNGGVATITSGGNSPTCTSETSATITFVFQK